MTHQTTPNNTRRKLPHLYNNPSLPDTHIIYNIYNCDPSTTTIPTPEVKVPINKGVPRYHRQIHTQQTILLRIPSGYYDNMSCPVVIGFHLLSFHIDSKLTALQLKSICSSSTSSSYVNDCRIASPLLSLSDSLSLSLFNLLLIIQSSTFQSWSHWGIT